MSDEAGPSTSSVGARQSRFEKTQKTGKTKRNRSESPDWDPSAEAGESRTTRPRRSAATRRARTPDPAPPRKKKRGQREAFLRCHGMTIPEADLLRFVWAVQSQGYGKLEQVAVEMGYAPGAARKLLAGLAERFRRQQKLGVRDVFSAEVFPGFYDEIIAMLREEHAARAGKSAVVASNAWSLALRVAASHIKFPDPSECRGVDYARICSYLSDCLRGVLPPNLNQESEAALMRAMRGMQDQAQVFVRSRREFSDFVAEKLTAHRQRKSDRSRRGGGVGGGGDGEPGVWRDPEPEYPPERAALFDGPAAAAAVDDRIEWAMTHSPAINPLRMPMEYLKL